MWIKLYSSNNGLLKLVWVLFLIQITSSPKAQYFACECPLMMFAQYYGVIKGGKLNWAWDNLKVTNIVLWS